MTSRDKRRGAAVEMTKVTPAAQRTPARRTLPAHASANSVTNAERRPAITTSAMTTIQGLPRWPRPSPFASPVAHAGGRAPAGSGVVSGDIGAPAKTATKKYPATMRIRHHRARVDVCLAVVSAGRLNEAIATGLSYETACQVN